MSQVKNWPAQYTLVSLLIVLSIIFTFLLILTVPYCINSLTKDLKFIYWQDILGVTLYENLKLSFNGLGTLTYGISVELQKKWFSFIFLTLVLFYALTQFFYEFTMRNMGEKLSLKLRTQIIDQYIALGYSKTKDLSPGLLSAMVGENIREIQDSFTRLSGSILKEGLTSLVFVFWLIFLDSQLFLIFCAIIIPATLVLIVANKILKKLARKGLDEESSLISKMLEMMAGWQSIKSFKSHRFELFKFGQIAEKIYRIWKTATKTKSISSPLIEWLAMIALAFILFSAFKRITEGMLSSEVLLSFIITIGYIADKMNIISIQINSTKKGTEALSRIQAFLEIKRERSHGEHGIPEHFNANKIESIEIKELSIGLSKQDVLAKDINLKLTLGDILLIKGPSGVGKSTLLRTVLGLEKPLKGHILLNGHPISEKIFDSVSKNIAFVTQDPYIFSGTICENICYPNSHYKHSKTDIKTALSLSNLKKSPQISAHMLSGGERQRLMFARAFYSSPSLLLIDEGTSALDSSNEAYIMNSLLEKKDHCITILIAHRASLLKYANKVLDLTSKF